MKLNSKPFRDYDLQSWTVAACVMVPLWNFT